MEKKKVHSPTRRRFNEKRKLKSALRKREEGMIVCLGTIARRGEKVPCGYALYPRRTEIDSIITCHRCGQGHIKAATGKWITFREDAMMKGKL